MNPNDKPNSTTDAQRRAAIEIARQKVLSSLERDPNNYFDAEAEKAKKDVKHIVKEASSTNSQVINEQAETYNKTYSDKQSTQKIDDNSWKKYHSAWQNYYQKYYENYYTSAVKQTARKIREQPSASVQQNKDQIRVAQPTVEDEEETKKRAFKELRQKIRNRADKSVKKFRKSRHFIPILAGLLVVLVFVFLQYNRFFAAIVKAYVIPGNSDVNSITEIDPTLSTSVSGDPKLIIPKINIEVPIVFGLGNDHASQQSGMSRGVTHFAIPGANSVPGQVGNTVLSGHSSNDVFEGGNFKFIFAQLDKLENGDIIYINYEGVRYTYVVSKKETVWPNEVQKLIYETDKPVLTLITCMPLGSAKYRLLVTAEQINPSSEHAKPADTVSDTKDEPESMPSNSPTIIERIINFFTGNN